MGLCMALSMNSVEIPGRFRGNAGFSGKFAEFGVVSGDLGTQKAFAQIASLERARASLAGQGCQ